MSRDQVGRDKAKKKAQWNRKTNEIHVGIGFTVCFFDTINLPVAGEYFVRGQISKNYYSSDAGIFEPMRGYDNEADYVIATGMVNADERRLIPIKLLTCKDNVRITKGTKIGTFTKCEFESKPVRINKLS